MIRNLRFRFLFGLFAGFAGAFLLGELITRVRSPEDLQPFLGETSRLTGIYRPDPELGADYQSIEAFRARYRERLRQLEDPNRPQRIWMWFGNSFVQAQGMLGDLAQADHPDIRMFYLQRTAELQLHVAQLRLLLDNGLKPERVIQVLVPVDLLPLTKKPLRMIAVNSRGAITYGWRTPPLPLDALVHSSRLALLAWVRTGRNESNPSFHPRQITDKPPASLLQDLGTIFHVIGRVSREHHVPVTVLLLPNREQVFGKAGYALQDFEGKCCRTEGIDCFDARDVFVNEKNKLLLFLPDWHFTTKANRLVLDALYSHWEQQTEQKSSP